MTTKRNQERPATTTAQRRDLAPGGRGLAGVLASIALRIAATGATTGTTTTKGK